MLHNEVGLITTFVLGIFILIGALVSLFFKSKDKIINFSVGLAFGVIVGLIVCDLVPEIIENLGIKYCYVFLFFSVLGFYILKVLDGVVPHHHDHYASRHEKLNKEEKSHNLTHIGLVTTVALIIHNVIEGAAVYSSSLADPSLAMSLALGVGFHNIPLGMVLSSSFFHSHSNKKMAWILIILVSLSTFLGGVIMYLFDLRIINPVVLGGLLSMTLGMLVFIVVDELFPRIKDTKDKKMTYMGICLGAVILLISMFIG